MEDVFKEKKDDRDEMEKKLVKKEVPKRGTWLTWCKKQWTGAGDPYLGRGNNRAMTELSFGHVTTKTWAYSGVFGFFRNLFG